MSTWTLWTLLAADVKAGGADLENPGRKTSSRVAVVIGEGAVLHLSTRWADQSVFRGPLVASVATVIR